VTKERTVAKIVQYTLTFDFLNLHTKYSSVCYVLYPFTTFDANPPQDTEIVNIGNVTCHLITSTRRTTWRQSRLSFLRKFLLITFCNPFCFYKQITEILFLRENHFRKQNVNITQLLLWV